MKIVCQKVIQNNVEFFIGKLCFEKLAKVAGINHRIISTFDDDGLPVYNDSFQRKVSTQRANDIKNYILSDQEATFPNSIILSLPSALMLEEIEDEGPPIIYINEEKINLDDKENPVYIQIIDGQHRFAGMKAAVEELSKLGVTDLLNKLLKFEFVVSIFIDAELDFQAMLFSTINRTPVKVPYDIVYDLFGLVEKDSPQKTALAICLELNSIKKDNNGKLSPFAGRIKLLGKKDKGASSYISQQIFIKTIITLICPSIRASEIERFKKRTDFVVGGTFKTIFRQFYAENRDNHIYKTLENFFVAVEETFVDQQGNSFWRIGETPDNPLQRTIGFLALIDVLIELFHIGVSEKKLSVDFFKSKLSKAQKISLLNENNETVYPYSSKGKSLLAEDLLSLILEDSPH
ncbi:DGQHR domain-containing protein [Parapedobacter luteus]|uniref:DGQHR domain-containing protein n=1 Tax=Parapedobacter luteus TaxID=623280 RepID=A0A1T5CTL7_9SPHI|nr:DGQHR domain-containing protein [Parapedobacter luteus]SKB62661.1 DGQHR domain-containing protein [Parapedobacter luteus]